MPEIFSLWASVGVNHVGAMRNLRALENQAKITDKALTRLEKRGAVGLSARSGGGLGSPRSPLAITAAPEAVCCK